ncbi:Transglycosylase SLT domain-containing protein [Propionispira arboris]|uniref:Transglycosylase SLT domain-containing protein n=1 Tax=Propionispira arboris TaxID=84035 RepID=A0A1H7A761_9FIRM|nr:lytic transglycosylase domain-containing protein [Propionispira arboris]SEJ60304.1 Transglycosylase SLT domain-containing protein [Propionispira arboris]
MSTVSEMLIKIGADSSGLKSEMTKTQETINTAFNTNPVNEFTNALTGATNGIGGVLGKLSGIAAVAAGGFGLGSMIESAVNAGESVYQLSNKLKISAGEAGTLSRILKLTGGDTDTFSGAMMRLDKNLSASGESSAKIKATLETFGVSVTDANGHMLPMNEQLKNLSAGYKKASDSGLQQEFIMNTLGVRGMALTKTLQNYNEASTNAAKIKSIGLDPEEMHKMSQELQLVKMQASQLELAGGAALAPVAEEMFPVILSGLTQTAKYLADNKTEIKDITKNALELLALYKSMQAIGKIGSGVSSFWGNATATAAKSIVPTVDPAALTTTQEKSINRAVATSNAGYAKIEKAAVKAAQTANLSATESAAIISEKCIEISNQAAIAAEKIRADMTASFMQSNISAKESLTNTSVSLQAVGVVATETADKVTIANNEIIASTKETATAQASLAETMLETGIAATAAGEKTILANAGIAESARGASVAEAELADYITMTGIEATIAGEKAAIANAETAETARAAAVAEAEVVEITTAAGLEAVETGTKAVGANTAAAAAALENAGANTVLTVATEAAGNEAVVTGTKTVGAMATAISAVGNLRAAVFALMGGWIGVAAATGYAIYKLVQYESTKNNIESYNSDAEVSYNKTTGKLQKKAWIEGKTSSLYDPTTKQNIEVTASDGGWGYKDLSDAEVEEHNAYIKYIEEQKNKKPWMDNGGYEDDKLAELRARQKELEDEAKSENKTGHPKTEKVEKDTTEHYSEIDKLGDYSNQALYAANTYGLDPNLYGALIEAESSGDPNARSSAGAIGFAQLMPDTAAGLGVNAYDPNDNLMGGAAYFKSMLDMFNGDIRLALAAYNASPDTVKAAGGVPNIPETQNYVSKVMGIYQGASTSKGPAQYDQAAELKKLQQAKEEAVTLYAGMATEIDAETSTTYSAGMDKIAQDVSKKAEQIAKLQAEGVDTTNLSAELGKYKDILKSKITDQWEAALRQLKDDSRLAHAQLIDDFAGQADAEYQMTVTKLDKERKEKLKSIQQDKNDKADALVVEQWYNDQVLIAQKDREKKQRDLHQKTMQSLSEYGNVSGSVNQLGTQQALDAQDLAGKQAFITEYYDLWKKEHKSAMEYMAEASGDFESGMENVFEDIGKGVKNAEDLIKSFGSLILSTIEKIVAERAATQITSSLLNSFLGTTANSYGGSMSSYMPISTDWLGTETQNASSGTGLVNTDWQNPYKFADGGIVTGPTVGMIGEAGYPEAIMPLTPQGMKNAGFSGSSGSANLQVNVNNYSTAKVAASQPQYSPDLQKWVLDIVVDGAERNVSGFNNNLKTSLGVGS